LPVHIRQIEHLSTFQGDSHLISHPKTNTYESWTVSFSRKKPQLNTRTAYFTAWAAGLVNAEGDSSERLKSVNALQMITKF